MTEQQTLECERVCVCVCVGAERTKSASPVGAEGEGEQRGQHAEALPVSTSQG